MKAWAWLGPPALPARGWRGCPWGAEAAGSGGGGAGPGPSGVALRLDGRGGGRRQERTSGMRWAVLTRTVLLPGSPTVGTAGRAGSPGPGDPAGGGPGGGGREGPASQPSPLPIRGKLSSPEDGCCRHAFGPRRLVLRKPPQGVPGRTPGPRGSRQVFRLPRVTGPRAVEVEGLPCSVTVWSQKHSPSAVGTCRPRLTPGAEGHGGAGRARRTRAQAEVGSARGAPVPSPSPAGAQLLARHLALRWSE